jgi:hypothetical protein
MKAATLTVSESNHWVNMCCIARGEQACDSRGEEEYSCNDCEHGEIAQVALGPAVDDIADTHAEKNTEDESHAGVSSG